MELDWLAVQVVVWTVWPHCARSRFAHAEHCDSGGAAARKKAETAIASLAADPAVQQGSLRGGYGARRAGHGTLLALPQRGSNAAVACTVATRDSGAARKLCSSVGCTRAFDSSGVGADDAAATAAALSS